MRGVLGRVKTPRCLESHVMVVVVKRDLCVGCRAAGVNPGYSNLNAVTGDSAANVETVAHSGD